MTVEISEVRELLQDLDDPPLLTDTSYAMAIKTGVSLYASASIAARMLASKFIAEADESTMYQVGGRKRNRYKKYMELSDMYKELSGSSCACGVVFDPGEECSIMPEGIEYES